MLETDESSVCMLDKWINSSVDRWIKNEIIKPEEKPVYIYGLDVFVSTIINILVIQITAAFLGLFWESAVFLTVIIPMQCVCGGYHADTHLRCFLIMYIGWWFVVPNVVLFSITARIIIEVVACVIVLILAPVSNNNVSLSFKRRLRMRRLSIVLAWFFFLLSMFLWFFNIKYSVYVTAALAVISVSAISASVKVKICSKRI